MVKTEFVKCLVEEISKFGIVECRTGVVIDVISQDAEILRKVPVELCPDLVLAMLLCVVLFLLGCSPAPNR